MILNYLKIFLNYILLIKLKNLKQKQLLESKIPDLEKKIKLTDTNFDSNTNNSKLNNIFKNLKFDNSTQKIISVYGKPYKLNALSPKDILVRTGNETKIKGEIQKLCIFKLK